MVTVIGGRDVKLLGLYLKYFQSSILLVRLSLVHSFLLQQQNGFSVELPVPAHGSLHLARRCDPHSSGCGHTSWIHGNFG